MAATSSGDERLAYRERRCPDCDLNGWLDSVGKVRDHSRVRACRCCGGRGRIRLVTFYELRAADKTHRQRLVLLLESGRARLSKVKDTVDPMLRGPRYDSLDELASLMAEPPGGTNFGRRRSASGRWVPLEPTDFSYLKSPHAELRGKPVPATDAALSIKRPVVRHGTASSYKREGCRCEACRKWWADYMRGRRLEQRLRSR